MTWQDIVIALANLVFSIALLVQVYYGFKEKSGPIKYYTSVPTFLGLFAISITFLTLSLYFSASVTFLAGIMWFILFIQRVIYQKNEKR